MNSHRFMTLTALAALLFAGTFSQSCSEKQEAEEPQKLQSPAPAVTSQDATSFTIEWDTVEGAASYAYRCSWDETENVTEATSLSFTDLTPDATYTVSVMAVPEDPQRNLPSDYADISVTLEGEETSDAIFTIELTEDPVNRIVRYKITPKDPDMLFYRDAFEDNAWAQLGGNAEDVWANAVQRYHDLFGNSTLSMIAESGVIEAEFQYSYDQHTYILVAGIDTQLNRTTPIVQTVFYSGPTPPSDIRFDVQATDVGVSGAVVHVTPTNNDPWSMLLIESSDIESYSDEELEDEIRYSYSDYINDGHVYRGEIDMTYHDGQLTPDTEYTVLTFGWNTNLSTEIFRYTFRTEKASSSETLDFEWDIEVLGPTEIHATITPSDNEAQYIVIPMPQSDYETYGTDIYSYVEYVTMGMITPYQYASMFATTGVTDRVFNDFDDGIYPGSSYMFCAVGVDLDTSTETVTFYSPQFYQDAVTTPEQ